MAAETINYEEVGLAIARGMARYGNSSSFSSANPSGQRSGEDLDRLAHKDRTIVGNRIKQMRQMYSLEKKKLDQTKKLNKILATTGSVQNKAIRELKGDYTTLGKHMDALSVRLKDAEKGSKEEITLKEELNDITKKQIKTGEELVEANKRHSSSVGKGVAAVGGAMLRVAGVIKDDVMAQLAAGSQLGIGTMQKFSIQLGTSTEQIAKLEAANRQAFNAVGGSEAVFTRLTNRLDMFDQGFIQSIGGWNKATEYFANSMTVLAAAGIKPTEEAFKEMHDEQMAARKIFGLNAEGFLDLNKRLAENEDIQRALRGLDMEQRRVRMESLRQQFLVNGALGMTAEQAMKAAETLAEIGGDKALNRIQKAARLQALGSALGIEGADEAAEAMRAGAKATHEQREALQLFLGRVGDIGVEARTQMSLAGEMMVQTVVSRLGLEKEANAIVMRGTEARRMNEEALAAGRLDMINEERNAIIDLAMEAQRAENVLKDKFFGGLLGAVGGLSTFTTALGIAAAASIGGAAKGLLGGAARGAGTLARGAGTLAVGSQTAGSMIGGGGRAIAGRLGMVGMAGAAGFAAGTALYESSETTRDFMHYFMKTVDKGLAAVGSEEAQERLAALENTSYEDIKIMREQNAAAAAAQKGTLSETEKTNQLLTNLNTIMTQVRDMQDTVGFRSPPETGLDTKLHGDIQ